LFHSSSLAERRLPLKEALLAKRSKGAIFFFRSGGFLAFLVQGLTNLMASLP
jgi:hypothetical protein